MKITYLLFACSLISLSQEVSHFSLYGNAGIGLSRVHYTGSKNGTVGEIGVTVSYYNCLLKFDRTVNNEFQLLIPEEKISSNTFLIGYSFQPFGSISEIYLNGKIGIGSVEYLKRGKMIINAPFDHDYEMVTEKSNSTQAEIDVELRLTQNIGFYLSTFSHYNHSKNIYGANVGIVFGFF